MNAGMNVKTKQSDEYETPQWLFNALDAEFGFTLDGAAIAGNAKCAKYCDVHTPPDWWEGQRVFCNPPYSDIETFVKRASSTEICVLLLPSRTGTHWFRMLVERGAEIRFFRKRIRFLENGKEQGSPRFDSLVAIVK
jgi:phage N-6-adenine-methyltransferase